MPEQPTILVVEDNEVHREGIRLILTREGYHVQVVTDGAEALAFLRQNPPPKVMVIDMFMPVLDGWFFLAEVTRLSPRPKIIVATGGTSFGREWAADHGCAGFVRKPIVAEELLLEIRNCVDGQLG